MFERDPVTETTLIGSHFTEREIPVVLTPEALREMGALSTAASAIEFLENV